MMKRCFTVVVSYQCDFQTSSTLYAVGSEPQYVISVVFKVVNEKLLPKKLS